MVLIEKLISDPSKEHPPSKRSHFKIIGVGRFGKNVVTRLKSMNINDIECLSINTDLGTSRKNINNKKDKTEFAYEEIIENVEELVSITRGFEIIFLIVGVGEHVSSDVATIIADIAKHSGSLVISLINIPFKHELSKYNEAIKDLNSIRNSTDTTIILNNNKFLEAFPQLPFDLTSQMSDENVVNIIKEIVSIFNQSHTMGLNHQDLDKFFRAGGWSAVGIGRSETPNRVEEAAKNAIHNTMLNSDYKRAKGALIQITGGADLTLDETVDAAEIVTKNLEKNTTILWDSRTEPAINNYLKFTLILTGISSPIDNNELKFLFNLYEMEPVTAHENRVELTLNIPDIEFVD